MICRHLIRDHEMVNSIREHNKEADIDGSIYIRKVKGIVYEGQNLVEDKQKDGDFAGNPYRQIFSALRSRRGSQTSRSILCVIDKTERVR